MEIINPIYRLMNFNQSQNKMNPMNQNMQSLNQINYFQKYNVYIKTKKN